MDVLIPHDTILESTLTELPLQFKVQVKGFNILGLKPCGKQIVNASKILKISRRLESASWPIKVYIGEQFSGLKLEAKHFLDYVIFNFDFQIIENGKYILVARGVKEEMPIDMFLRMGRGIGQLALRKPQLGINVSQDSLTHKKVNPLKRKPQLGINISKDSVTHKEVNPSKRKPQLGINVSQDSLTHKEVNPLKRKPQPGINVSQDSVTHKEVNPSKRKPQLGINISKDSATHKEVNMSKRKPQHGINVSQDSLTHKEVNPLKRKPQLGINVSQDSVTHNEVNPSKRKTTTGKTTLAGSILHGEKRVPRFSGRHNSTHSPTMDNFEYILLFVLALAIFSFLMLRF